MFNQPRTVFLHADICGRELDTAHDVQPATDIFTGRTAALAGRGAMHVGRALVRGIFVENILALRTPAILAILVYSEGELLIHFLF
jgi:hypothetical protein